MERVVRAFWKNDRLVRFELVDQVPFRAVETVPIHKCHHARSRREGRSEMYTLLR